MTNPNPPASEATHEIAEGSFLEGIPGHYTTLGLGIFSMGFAGVAYLPALSILAMFDLPVAFLCFMTAAFVGLGSREKMGLVLAGVVLAAVGLVLSAVHLIVVHNHPWLS